MPGYKVSYGTVHPSDEQQLKREDFIGKRAHGRICCVMAETFHSAQSSDLPTDPLVTFPWLTPVLGSGCLSTSVASRIKPEGLARAVEAAVAAFEAAPAGSESWQVIARNFTLSLAEARRRLAAPPRPGTPPVTPEVGELAARMIVIAALLTRFCHGARAIGPNALDRLADEQIVLSAQWPQISDPFKLAETVVAPLLTLIADTQTLLSSQIEDCELTDTSCAVESAVFELLETIESGLKAREPMVGMNTIRLMTETAWYEVVRDPDEYYGWSELLLGLILSTGRPGMHQAQVRSRRPKFRHLNDVPEPVAALFRQPTLARWHELHESDRLDDTVHVAVARILEQQAAAFRELPDQVPLPLAFSTSFDIELEMALWRIGQPFRVALPVHVETVEPGVVELIWVVGDVTPEVGLDEDVAFQRLTAPTNWRALVDHAAVKDGRPLVVHLAGAPLFSLKEIWQKRSDGGGDDLACVLQKADMKVRFPNRAAHAVAIDEYLALREAEAEIYWSLHRNPNAADKRGPNLSMIFLTLRRLNPLYWTLLGVPIGDPAVRQRVMSLLTMRWIATLPQADGDVQAAAPPSPGSDADSSGREPSGLQGKAALFGSQASSVAVATDEGPLPNAPDDTALSSPPESDTRLPRSVVGVAINARLDQEEASLLSWLGLKVVHAECAEFVDDLLDYARHLRGADAGDRWLDSEGCAFRNVRRTGASA